MSIAPSNIARDTSQGVREDTAELASWALSDIASNRSEHSPSRNHTSPKAQHVPYQSSQLNQDDLTRHASNSPRPEAIEEVPEPTSLQSSQSSQKSHAHSALTELLRDSHPTEEDSHGTDEDELPTVAGLHPVTVQEGIISQPSERTTLLDNKTAYGSIKDLEGQQVARSEPTSRIDAVLQRSREHTALVVRIVSSPKSWDRHDILEYGVRQPASFVPPVILGLLLNILDALSYGDIQLSNYQSEQITDSDQV